MKALTVRQPWAQLIAQGVKTIETRSWTTKYRGPLVIHAAKSHVYYAAVGDYLTEEGLELYRRSEPFPKKPVAILSLGAIVASCKLVDCVPIATVASAKQNNLQRCVCVFGGLLALNGGGRWGSPHAVDYLNISDQLPYGDFTPGRFAWLLEDIQPVEKRCPACWGKRQARTDWVGTTDMGLDFGARFVGKERGEVVRCATCNGKGHIDPIPAKGKQGLWEWTP